MRACEGSNPSSPVRVRWASLTFPLLPYLPGGRPPGVGCADEAGWDSFFYVLVGSI
jgi:hypothetical protein